MMHLTMRTSRKVKVNMHLSCIIPSLKIYPIMSTLIFRPIKHAWHQPWRRRWNKFVLYQLKRWGMDRYEAFRLGAEWFRVCKNRRKQPRAWKCLYDQKKVFVRRTKRPSWRRDRWIWTRVYTFRFIWWSASANRCRPFQGHRQHR